MQEKDLSRRRLLHQGVGGAALVALLGNLPIPAHAFFRRPRELPPGRSIYELRGTVRVDGIKASRESQIRPASIVETGSNSQVIFRVGADAHILRENARIELASGDGLVVEGLRLLSGALLSVFGERHSGPGYRLQTPVATIGIRGTGLYAAVEPGASYVCTCYGKVELSASDDPSQREDVSTEHHESPRYILANPEKGRRIVEAPMKDHTDEELALIEAIVGRKTPFADKMKDDPDFQYY